MSRIGKQPVLIPDGVTVEINDRNFKVKGPKGELQQSLHRHVQVSVTDKQASITVKHPDEQSDRALWGLYRALLANMIEGVTKGFAKRLEINGVGFRAQSTGNNLQLFLGFSHPVDFPIPAGISVTVEKNVITVTGIEKQLVGEIAAKIRNLKKPEPYKGKGIKYEDEVIRRKAGKVVKAAGAK